MATFLVLRLNPPPPADAPALGAPNPDVAEWRIVEAKADDADGAIAQAFSGDGDYTAIRWDNRAERSVVSAPEVQPRAE